MHEALQIEIEIFVRVYWELKSPMGSLNSFAFYIDYDDNNNNHFFILKSPNHNKPHPCLRFILRQDKKGGLS